MTYYCKWTNIEMSLLCNLSEQLHWNASPNVNESVEFAQSLNIRKLHRKGPSAWMNVEWNRIRSFDCANVSSGAEELLTFLHEAIGDLLHVDFFYMKYPTTEGDLAGFCVHFEALVSIPTTDCPSFRNLLSNPLRELEKLMPSSKFLNNFDVKCYFRVHISVNASWSPPIFDVDRNSSKISGSLANFIASSLCPRTPIVATASSDGNVNIWRVDTLILLFTIPSLSPTQKSSSTCLIEPWLCAANAIQKMLHTVERCLLCDTPAPGWEAPKIANSNGDKYFDMLLKYLHANNFEAVLSSIFIISNAPYEAESASLPDHKNRHEQSIPGGDGTHQHASNNPAECKRYIYRVV